MGWLTSDPDRCLLLADLVVTVHFGIVAFVLLGALAIPLGGWRGWEWVRGRSFRLIHFVVVLVVALQQDLCFLTRWEIDLRRMAGRGIEEASFVGRLLHDWLFVEVDLDTLQRIYIAFGVLVLLGLFAVPPRLKAQR
ncbi:MAG: DUF2784 domain-containing protein [Planctomycetes bacterium]|nr:DUF2784 domain-containing protein [Planctomycetota bacterium]